MEVYIIGPSLTYVPKSARSSVPHVNVASHQGQSQEPNIFLHSFMVSAEEELQLAHNFVFSDAGPVKDGEDRSASHARVYPLTQWTSSVPKNNHSRRPVEGRPDLQEYVVAVLMEVRAVKDQIGIWYKTTDAIYNGLMDGPAKAGKIKQLGESESLTSLLSSSICLKPLC